MAKVLIYKCKNRYVTIKELMEWSKKPRSYIYHRLHKGKELCGEKVEFVGVGDKGNYYRISEEGQTLAEGNGRALSSKFCTTEKVIRNNAYSGAKLLWLYDIELLGTGYLLNGKKIEIGGLYD